MITRHRGGLARTDRPDLEWQQQGQSCLHRAGDAADAGWRFEWCRANAYRRTRRLVEVAQR